MEHPESPAVELYTTSLSVIGPDSFGTVPFTLSLVPGGIFFFFFFFTVYVLFLASVHLANPRDIIILKTFIVETLNYATFR